MSTGRAWKLYLALEGEPRQLIDAFATFREAAGAFAEIVGIAGQKVPFRVTIDIRSQPLIPNRTIPI